jgi:hypothetical protein
MLLKPITLPHHILLLFQCLHQRNLLFLECLGLGFYLILVEIAKIIGNTYWPWFVYIIVGTSLLEFMCIIESGKSNFVIIVIKGF